MNAMLLMYMYMKKLFVKKTGHNKILKLPLLLYNYMKKLFAKKTGHNKILQLPNSKHVLIFIII